MGTVSDSWKPLPRRGFGEVGGKAALVVVLVAVVVLAAVGVWRLLGADTAKREDAAIAAVAREVADSYCVRVEGTTAGESTVPSAPFSATLCDGSMAGTLQVAGRQPAGFVTAGVSAYVHGDDFVWAEMGVSSPGDVTVWAALPDNPASGPFTFTPSRVADAVDRGRTGAGTGGMGFVDFGDVSVRADESTSTLHVVADGQRWRVSPFTSAEGRAVEREVVAATSTPWFVEDRSGVLVLVGPEMAPPEELEEIPVPPPVE